MITIYWEMYSSKSKYIWSNDGAINYTVASSREPMFRA